MFWIDLSLLISMVFISLSFKPLLSRHDEYKDLAMYSGVIMLALIVILTAVGIIKKDRHTYNRILLRICCINFLLIWFLLKLVDM